MLNKKSKNDIEPIGILKSLGSEQVELASAWIVDKPPGLSVHNADSTQDTLDLIQLLKRQLNLPALPLPVNRLDKETSGVMVLAADSKTAAALVQALAAESSSKQYAAILRGQIGVAKKALAVANTAEDSEFGTSEIIWSWPISDKAEGRSNPQGKAADRVVAKSIVKIEKQNRFFTQVKIVIQTGRQHQIRKHAAISKNAIVGDTRYGDKKYNEMIAKRYSSSRMFLHSQTLCFQYQGQNIFCEANLPIEFSKLFENNEKDSI